MLEEDVTPRRRLTPGNGSWYGVIAKPAADMNDFVYVVIPAFSRTMRFGPCRWQSRDATSLPARGDDCLVIFDNNKIPWVAAWWPFD